LLVENIMTGSSGRVHQITEGIKSFLYGAMLYGLVSDTIVQRGRAEYALMLVTVGDMLGYPISSYYRLRLLPYWIHRLNPWKRYFLKERDLVERLG